MKLKKISLLFALMLLSSCNIYVQTSGLNNFTNSSEFSEDLSSDSSVLTSLPTSIPSIDVPSTPSISVEETNFSVSASNSDGYTIESNICRITKAGTYDIYGTLNEGQIYVEVPDTDKVTINLNGVYLSNSTNSPIFINSGNKIEISAKKDTQNFIYDLRTQYDSNSTDETIGSGAIFARSDLEIKGKGELTVESTANNGIHTKKDLEIKNLTLKVTAVNNSIRGNDSITIESGTIYAISSGGDGLKTSSTDLNKKSEQRGKVTISGGEVNIFSACDGIDCSSDVLISDTAIVNIFTDEYSQYSGDVMTKDSNLIYIRLSSTVYNYQYKYSGYFYNPDGSYEWVNATYYGIVNSTDQPSWGGGGPGGGSRPGSNTSYYYYTLNKPTNFTSLKIYAYNSTQEQSQNQNYIAVNNNYNSIPDGRDTFTISSISTSSKTISSNGWTNFSTSNGNTGLAYSCKGIKASNQIEISGGVISIKSKDDAIHANFDDILESTNEKGKGNIIISGGSITVSTNDDGFKADQDLTIKDGVINVLNSYEGIEANRIYIEGGTTKVYAKDDAVNANSKGAYKGYIEISGGNLDLEVPNGDTDTLDSNGTILISGGYVLLKNGQTNGISMTGGTIDCDNGVTVTGGTVVSIGCICREGIISNSSYSSSTSLQSGDYTLEDSDGQVLYSFTLNTSFKAYMIWSDLFVSGNTYYLKSNGNIIVTIKK